jgi:hypothetical protein
VSTIPVINKIHLHICKEYPAQAERPAQLWTRRLASVSKDPIQSGSYQVTNQEEGVQENHRRLEQTSGKLTAPAVVPRLTYLMREVATSLPMAACASSVDPPMWGVRITFGSPCSSAAASRQSPISSPHTSAFWVKKACADS